MNLIRCIEDFIYHASSSLFSLFYENIYCCFCQFYSPVYFPYCPSSYECHSYHDPPKSFVVLFILYPAYLTFSCIILSIYCVTLLKENMSRFCLNQTYRLLFSRIIDTICHFNFGPFFLSLFFFIFPFSVSIL